jgi:hypothetical protein
MIFKSIQIAAFSCLVFACEKHPPAAKSQPSATTTISNAESKDTTKTAIHAPTKLAEPTVLADLPVSAYNASLSMDEGAVFLLTQTAAYRIVPGQPPQGLKLDLGIGPALTPTAFIHWSKGSIWKTPKEGGDSVKLASFRHQPQYFVASGESFAWIDLNDDGTYTIQTLDGQKPRVLVSSKGELAALNLIGKNVYFVHRPTDSTWRPGVVNLSGGEPTYGAERNGRRPSMLVGSDGSYFYDVDKNDIRVLSQDVQKEETLLSQFICSPLHVSRHVYCACVDGLFAVSKDTRKPTVLAGKQSGPIPYVTSNEKWVAWLVDTGRDRLTVNLLPALGAETKAKN